MLQTDIQTDDIPWQVRSDTQGSHLTITEILVGVYGKNHKVRYDLRDRLCCLKLRMPDCLGSPGVKKPTVKKGWLLQRRINQKSVMASSGETGCAA